MPPKPDDEGGSWGLADSEALAGGRAEACGSRRCAERKVEAGQGRMEGRPRPVAGLGGDRGRKPAREPEGRPRPETVQAEA